MKRVSQTLAVALALLLLSCLPEAGTPATLTPTTAHKALTCRSTSVKHAFDMQQGYPKGRPGYVVDHVCALYCGGKDSTTNMQYQTKSESLKKDKWEATPIGCALTCTPLNSTRTRQVFNCK